MLCIGVAVLEPISKGTTSMGRRDEFGYGVDGLICWCLSASISAACSVKIDIAKLSLVQNVIKAYEQIRDEEVDHLQQMVDNIKLEQWRAGAQQFITEAKKVSSGFRAQYTFLFLPGSAQRTYFGASL